MPLRVWRCPKCRRRQEALGAFTVGHRCPSHKNQWVDFAPEETDTSKGQAAGAGGSAKRT